MLFDLANGDKHTLGVKFSNGKSYAAIRNDRRTSPNVENGSLQFYFRETCNDNLGISSYPKTSNPFEDYDKVTFKYGVTECSLGDNNDIVTAVYIKIGNDLWVSPVESHAKMAHSAINIESFIHQD